MLSKNKVVPLDDKVVHTEPPIHLLSQVLERQAAYIASKARAASMIPGDYEDLVSEFQMIYYRTLADRRFIDREDHGSTIVDYIRAANWNILRHSQHYVGRYRADCRDVKMTVRAGGPWELSESDLFAGMGAETTHTPDGSAKLDYHAFLEQLPSLQRQYLNLKIQPSQDFLTYWEAYCDRNQYNRVSSSVPRKVYAFYLGVSEGVMKEAIQGLKDAYMDFMERPELAQYQVWKPYERTSPADMTSDMFTQRSLQYGLNTSMLNQTLRINFQKVRIVGAVKARPYPFIVKVLRTGELYRVSADVLSRFNISQPTA